jgi:hypothetical protein
MAKSVDRPLIAPNCKGLRMAPSPRPVRRVVVAGDVLRPTAPSSSGPSLFVSSQKANTRWLYYLISHPLLDATGLPVELVRWSDGGFDTPAFYEACEAPPNIDGWAQLFDLDPLPTGALDLVHAAFSDALVVGFELAPVLKRAFGQLGIPWIELCIGPVRFADDLFLKFSCSSDEVFEDALRFHRPLRTVQRDADLIRATCSRSPWPNIPWKGPLIIGQSRYDRSVIVNGRFVDYRDFRNDLRSLLSGKKILFKPHPYDENEFGVSDLVDDKEKISVVKDNIYRLLTMDPIQTIVTVSSSVGYEAVFFGKTVHWLGPQSYRAHAGQFPSDRSEDIIVQQEILTSDFWRIILRSTVYTSPLDYEALPFVANRLRGSLQSSWGYPAFADK